jgi:hypothetical protein
VERRREKAHLGPCSPRFHDDGSEPEHPLARELRGPGRKKLRQAGAGSPAVRSRIIKVASAPSTPPLRDEPAPAFSPLETCAREAPSALRRPSARVPSASSWFTRFWRSSAPGAMDRTGGQISTSGKVRGRIPVSFPSALHTGGEITNESPARARHHKNGRVHRQSDGGSICRQHCSAGV